MSSAPKHDRPELTEWAYVHLGMDLARVGPVVDDLRAWLHARGATSETWLDEVTLAITEALTNAIRHGGGGRTDFTVRLAWSKRGDAVEILVSEPGSFTPSARWHELPADPLSEGGRGGHLITQLMDAVEHRNAGGHHTLHMRRRIGTAEPSKPVADTMAPTASADVEAALTAMTEELGNAYETIAALFSLAEGLATTPELRALAGKSLANLLPLLGADSAWVRLAEEDGSLTRLSADGQAPSPGPATISPGTVAIETEVARSALERTLERRSELAADDPLHRAEGSAFVCPFAFEGRLRGVLAVARDTDAAGFFTAGQIGLARTLADFLGIACANADLQRQRQARLRAQRELEIAAQIQRALLPSSIAPHPAWNVRGVCAQAAEVGGDFYDVIDLGDGARLVVIADVMGKGVPAALVATTLRTALRSLATTTTGPGELLTRVNRQLVADLDRLGMFITVQILRLDATGAEIRYANAGHCPPLAFAANDAVQWWDETGGLPVGVEARETYTEARGVVAPGKRLWLMTDGSLEHEDARGTELGADGLASLAAKAADAPALLAALNVRAEGRPPRDDCTLVLITPRATPPTP